MSSSNKKMIKTTPATDSSSSNKVKSGIARFVKKSSPILLSTKEAPESNCVSKNKDSAKIIDK